MGGHQGHGAINDSARGMKQHAWLGRQSRDGPRGQVITRVSAVANAPSGVGEVSGSAPVGRPGRERGVDGGRPARGENAGWDLAVGDSRMKISGRTGSSKCQPHQPSPADVVGCASYKVNECESWATRGEGAVSRGIQTMLMPDLGGALRGAPPSPSSCLGDQKPPPLRLGAAYVRLDCGRFFGRSPPHK